MQRVQIIIRGAILLLIVLLAFLGYYYWKLVTPPTQEGADSGTGVSHVMSLYGFGSSKEQQLEGPDGLAVAEDGTFYVADSGHSRMMAFDKNGRFIRTFGKKGTKKGQLLFPLGVEAYKGKIYVASMILSKMMIYSPQGKLLKEVYLDRPIRIKARNDRLWITTPSQVWVTDLNGNLLRQYFRRGKGSGELNYPNGLAFDSQDNVFVSDSLNNRIQIMDKTGNLVGSKGEPTKELNQENRLFGLGMGAAIDDQDRLFIADAFHSSVQVFDHDGNPLAELGVEGSNDGQLDHPSEIVYMGGNKFAVADKNNDRVQVLSLNAPSKAGEKIPDGNNNIPYLFGGLAALIAGWIVWRIMRARKQVLEEESSSF